MFATVEGTVSTRLTEAKRMLALARTQEGYAASEARALRRLVYVVLYGVIEYAVKSAVQIALQRVGGLRVRYADLNQAFYAVALDPSFTALAFVGAERKWTKRSEFLTLQTSNEVCKPSDTLFDDQTMNVRFETVSTLFECFCISDPVVPNLRLKGLLNDIANNRNDVAHGSLSAQAVGARRTTEEMEKFVDDVETVVTHILACFEARLTQLTFVRVGQRISYGH
jgi:hypothetical protein